MPNSFGIPLVIFVAFSLSGCLKAIEHIRENPGEEIKVCRVEKILTDFHDGPVDGNIIDFPDPFEVDFHYNAAGEPIDMLSSFSLYNGQNNDYFRYDKLGRLKDFLISYNKSGVIIWNRYSYPQKNQIRDSVFDYGGSLITDPNPEQEQFADIVTYQLDPKGRIVKATLEFPSLPGSTFVTNYVYDARGNLVRPGITYDDKVNPFRTSSTFMFIYQDYSVNNPSTTHASAYNAYGLPTDITGFDVFGGEFGPSTIQYSCSMAWK